MRFEHHIIFMVILWHTFHYILQLLDSYICIFLILLQVFVISHRTVMNQYIQTKNDIYGCRISHIAKQRILYGVDLDVSS